MNKFFYYYDAAITYLVRSGTRMFAIFHGRLLSTARLGAKEQIVFMKRFAMMLQSGMPIIICLKLLEEESTKSSQKSLIAELLRRVASGASLSLALEARPDVWSQFVVTIVRVGESSGILADMLAYIAVELKKKNELRRQILGALLYPSIVILATLVITVFLLVVIFPKILPIFESLAAELPLSTKILIELSHLFSQYGIWIAMGIVIVCILYTIFRQYEQFRYWSDFLLLQIPISGRLLRYYNLANLCRTLGLLLQNEVRIMTAVTIISEATAHRVYRLALVTASVELATGKTFSSQLQKNPELYPSLLIQMIQAGELTGNLSSAFLYLSEMYESDIRDTTKNLTTVLEPVLMVGMGLCVGFIAISIITPIYGITQHLHA